MTREPMMREDLNQILIPLVAEEVSVAKRQIVTGRVQVSTVTREREELVDELLAREQVEVKRVPVGRTLDEPPAMRTEGDTLIIPVVEEVLVVERRLLLKEEVHVRRVRATDRHQERVSLRRQEAVITRHPATTEGAAEGTRPESK
jgi:stress response protein YsnF